MRGIRNSRTFSRTFSGNTKPRRESEEDFGDSERDYGRRKHASYQRPALPASDSSKKELPLPVYTPDNQPFTVMTFDRPTEKRTRDGLAVVSKCPMFYSKKHPDMLVFKGKVIRMFVECWLEKPYARVTVKDVVGVRSLPFSLRNRKPYAAPVPASK